MTPEAWTAHYVLWGLASVAVGWLLHRTASRTRSYQTEAFAHLEADRLALTRFVSGIDEREAARATASAAHLDSILSTPAEDAFYRGFLIHFRLPADTSPADVSALLARALASLKPIAETARTATGEPLPVRIEAPVAGT